MKLTLTPKELCAWLGISASLFSKFRNSNGKFAGYDGMGVWYPILSINSKIELDECEKCEHEKKWHSTTDREYACGKCMLERQEGVKHRFKPRLATVKGVKLVETCECGRTKYGHEVVRFKNCKQFKPVQTVEITYEEASK